MEKLKIEGDYLCLSVSGRDVKIPLNFIRVLTPIYDINATFFYGSGESRYTFDIWIYPTFADAHHIILRHIEATGSTYSTLPPTTDFKLAQKMHDELSRWNDMPRVADIKGYTFE